MYFHGDMIEEQTLWDGIRRLSPGDNVAWISLGDFNDLTDKKWEVGNLRSISKIWKS